MDRLIANNFTVLTPQEFLQDFSSEVRMAEQRIWTQAMYLEPGRIADTLVQLFASVSSKNIDKKLHIDHFGLLTTDGHPDYLKKLALTGRKKLVSLDRFIQNKKQLYVQLRDTGLEILFTNPPTLAEKIWPYHGRNHMKMSIIDSTAYVGGLNFSDDDFLHADFMVKLTDPDVVAEVANLFLLVDNQRLSDDQIIHINEETTLFIDSGKPGKSIILDRATHLAWQAEKSIYYVNQFIPDGKFLQALFTKYKLGKTVEVVVPRRDDFTNIFTLIHKMNHLTMRMKKRLIPLVFYPTIVHAKLVIIDEKTVFFGSHNLSDKGVKMGTAEVAIQSTNHELVQNLLQFYRNLTKSVKVS